jgi:alpha-amylase
MTYSEFINKFPPAGRIYLPAASYFEMSEWSLPADSQEQFEHVAKKYDNEPGVKRFLRGGIWRNFLTKYPESNNMHKKMIHVSNKLSNFKSGKKAAALDSLYAGQCNCAYWHGVFGGLYLPHLRAAVYKNLIDAEKKVTDKTGCKIYPLDIDCDGKDEILCESALQNLYISPERGGTIFEWDIMDKQINMLNVLTRRKEAYHSRLREFLLKKSNESHGGDVQTIHEMVKVKEADLNKYLNYDWYNRASLIDHFIHPNTKYDEFRNCKYGEQGNFVLEGYRAKVRKDSVDLERIGTVWINNTPFEIEILKKIIPRKNGLGIKYALTNKAKEDADIIFAPEFNYAFSYKTAEDEGIFENIDKWKRNDDLSGFALNMEYSRKVNKWVFPIETVSLSENGFERTYQGTVVVPIIKEKIKSNDIFKLDINIDLI